jgi:hypothetical protein
MSNGKGKKKGFSLLMGCLVLRLSQDFLEKTADRINFKQPPVNSAGSSNFDDMEWQ